MGLFNRAYNLNQLAKITNSNWEKKIDAPPEDKRMITEGDRAVTKHLIEQANQTDPEDNYSIWFIAEANNSLRKDVLNSYLIGTVNTVLANIPPNIIPPQFHDMSSFQIFYTLYNAAIRISNEQPAFNP